MFTFAKGIQRLISGPAIRSETDLARDLSRSSQEVSAAPAGAYRGRTHMVVGAVPRRIEAVVGRVRSRNRKYRKLLALERIVLLDLRSIKNSLVHTVVTSLS